MDKQACLHQSAWRRGWEDTKNSWSNWLFLLLEVIVSPLLGFVIGSLAGSTWGFVTSFGVVAFSLFSVWIVATSTAPCRQRNELRKMLLSVPGATQHSPKQAPQEIHIVLRQSTVLYPSEGHSHYPKERKDGARIPLLRTSIDISATEETSITAVSLDLLGSLIPSIEWKIYKFLAATLATSFGTTVYFQLPQSIARGTHTAKLQAFADGAWWASRPFDFTVPAPPTSDTSGSQP